MRQRGQVEREPQTRLTRLSRLWRAEIKQTAKRQKSFAILTLSLCVAINAGCTWGKNNTAPSNTALTQEPPTVSEPQWEKPFFKSLEGRLKVLGLPSLRTQNLPARDLEVRFWFEGSEIINGIILRRTNEKWSAFYVRQQYDSKPLSMKREPIGDPKSGWPTMWSKLVNAEILTLPDGSKPVCHAGVLDGIGYIVETNVGQTYRTFRYGNPQYATCEEAKQILAIEEILVDEFGPYKKEMNAEHY
ncbi:MAG TPA: hypothetical protein VI306_17380 [Pyrinomonadaceae bacterium]